MTSTITSIHARLPSLRLAAIAAALCLHLAAADAQPVSASNLYYRLGGSSPASMAVNRNMNSMRLGLSAGLKMNYSCGKFDVGMSWSTLMNSVSNLGATISGAIQAGISSLPLYVLQRAQPGLYQLFQNFSQKADLLVASSLKSCEEMEAMIRNGQNPYEDWVKMAKGESWKVKASASGDVVQAKADINGNEFAQKRGITWVNGKLAGGDSTDPIEPIKDISVAGYNATLNLPVSTSPSTDYRNTPHGVQRLVRAFKDANSLSTFTTEVLGDQAIKLSASQPTTTNTATGLGPKLEDELKDVQPKLVAAVKQSGGVSAQTLSEISAPGLGISPQLMEAIKSMPADQQALVIGRLSEEIAIHRVVDKALIARNVLITGLSLPEVQAAGDAVKDVQTKIDRLTQYIEDLLFEFRIRKEMTSSTALAILENQVDRSTSAAAVPGTQYVDPRPLEGGKVSQ
ncbi:integrating conjugative element protein [Corticibacter populi]|uniref:Integrating conjugative element protein n=1 Tax=Corticibacter populi TaxID=1550736 RepID=A0A3M6R0R9_9BURK|nr:integrating conjugative element protein [Corticibacter populi]RMX08856.1 integrating conjugative element protein [Corticibacter populi]RZS35407.1 integrating conjugative element protein (TIGR03755 family) [Corticibacter populi]